MKLSIIINVYQSYEIVERQLKHFNQMHLPSDIEIIIVDDGSSPAIWTTLSKPLPNNCTIHATHENRPWTQGLARNQGAELARGHYLLMTDIDHILSYEAIMDSYRFTEDKMIFPRYLGVLLEDGIFTQDVQSLLEYGADINAISGKRGLYASYHGNTFCMKKSTFKYLGGYSEKYCTYGFHATSKKGEDCHLNSKWNKFARDKNITPAVGSPIYIFPIGRFHKDYNTDRPASLNPMGLFHTLSYDPSPQPLKND